MNQTLGALYKQDFVQSVGVYLNKLIPPAWWRSPGEVRALYEEVANCFRKQLKETEEYLKDAVETNM